MLERIALSLAFLLVAGSPSIAQSAADPIEGKWYGMAGFPQDRVEIGFEFRRNERGELQGYLYQPVMNFYGLPLDGVVSRTGDTYSVESFMLSVTLHEGRLEGTYFPLHAPISLGRVETLPSEMPIPELPAGPGPRWRTKVGSPIAAPAAVRDGIAYVGTTGGMFYAVSLKDGSFVWPFVAGRAIYGAPLATEEAVYFLCDNGFLFKLDRKTGKEMWRYDLGDARVPRPLPHPVAPNAGDFDWDSTSPQPVLVDGVLYVGSGDSGMHAVSAATGQRVWRSAPVGKIRTDAVVDATRVYFGSYDNVVYAVDRSSGATVWRKDTKAQVTGSPALVGGRLVVGNRGGLVAALDPATGETVWRAVLWGSAVESTPVAVEDGLFLIGASDLRRVSLVDSKDGRVVWRTDVYGWAWPKPVPTATTVYQSTVGADPYQIRHVGSLTALDRATGKIRWRWQMPAWPGAWTSGFAASPVVAGDTLVVGGLDGTLYAFPAE